MKNNIRIILCLILFSIVLVHCKTKEKQPFGRNITLEGRKWMLMEINSVAVNVPVNAKTPYIEFNSGDNTFSAEGGCNMMNGMYTVQDKMIYIRNMASTKMACEQLETETKFFQALESSNRFELQTVKKKEKGQEFLILFQDETPVAKLESAKP